MMENALVGQRISRARIKLGMSTQQLAELIGKSQATVSRIENGKQGVNLLLLGKIAKVLKTHPFALLGTGEEVNGTFQKHGIFLHTILRSGRVKAKLPLAVAAQQAKMSIDRLNALEAGVEMPTQGELEAFCTEYSIDADLVNQIFLAEKKCPLILHKLCAMNALLADCLELARQAHAYTALSDDPTNLSRRIEKYLSDFACERQGDYFSIGHLSDQLMKALQDPDFHTRAEELARRWQPLEESLHTQGSEIQEPMVPSGSGFAHCESATKEPADKRVSKPYVVDSESE